MHTWGRHVLYFCSAVSCSKTAVLVSHDVLHKFTGVLDYTSFKEDLTWRLKISHRKRKPAMKREYFNSMFYLVHSDESCCSLWSNLFVCQELLWSVCAFGGILHLSETWCFIGWHFSYKQQSKVLSHQKPLQQSTPTIIISISRLTVKRIYLEKTWRSIFVRWMIPEEKKRLDITHATVFKVHGTLTSP